MKSAMKFPAFADSMFQEDHKRFSKVAKYAFLDYRHTLEDCIRDIIELDFDFPLSNFWTDVRIALGFFSAAVGVGGAVYGYLHPFHETTHVVGLCVLAYFALSALTTYVTVFLEGSKVAHGQYVDPLGLDQPITMSVATVADDSTGYGLKVQLEATQGARRAKLEATTPMEKYFTESGGLLGARFYDDMSAWVQDTLKQLGNK